MSEPKQPNPCPECGSNTYFAEHFERVRDRLYAVEEQLKRQAAAHAVEKANWTLKELDRKTNAEYMQAKAQRQRKALNRLEKRLRDLGKQPYGVEGCVGEEKP